jgi:hypothetical protein
LFSLFFVKIPHSHAYGRVKYPIHANYHYVGRNAHKGAHAAYGYGGQVREKMMQQCRRRTTQEESNACSFGRLHKAKASVYGSAKACRKGEEAGYDYRNKLLFCVWHILFIYHPGGIYLSFLM